VAEENGEGEKGLDSLLHTHGIPMPKNGAQPITTTRPGFGEPSH